ncbi:MAG: HDOD domain-containing protein [Acidobacteriia bacterium]|nr:HDOD domain-containing protein [Terriglobia bacterium]
MDVFLARQPIFDREQNVFAYELLFRSGLDNACRTDDLDAAASKVISDSVHLLGLETITGGKKAFVNVTREVLMKEHAALLPPAHTVVELLETVAPEPDVLAACGRLKSEGYLLALDDFVDRPEYEALVALADFVKVDVLATGGDERAAIVRRMAPRGIRMLAEKVETREMFEEAVRAGYSHFQGYFFARPAILATKDIPGYKLHLFGILQEVNRVDLDFPRIERILKQDAGLCYKFLRYINSAWFGWRQRIGSIKRALVLLGESEVRRWVTVIVLTGMAEDKPHELLVHAATRARFCELLAPLAGLARRSEELFLVGMLSLIDAVLDRPLRSLLKDLPISADSIAALLGEPSPIGAVFSCALAYERGDWEEFAVRAEAAGIPELRCPDLYLEALRWGGRCFEVEAA